MAADRTEARVAMPCSAPPNPQSREHADQTHPSAWSYEAALTPAAGQVNYRESISRPADIHYIHKKQSGGAGQFADISVRFEPGEAGSGFTFRSDIKGGAVSPLCLLAMALVWDLHAALTLDGEDRATCMSSLTVQFCDLLLVCLHEPVSAQAWS